MSQCTQMISNACREVACIGILGYPDTRYLENGWVLLGQSWNCPLHPIPTCSLSGGEIIACFSPPVWRCSLWIVHELPELLWMLLWEVRRQHHWTHLARLTRPQLQQLQPIDSRFTTLIVCKYACKFSYSHKHKISLRCIHTETKANASLHLMHGQCLCANPFS